MSLSKLRNKKGFTLVELIVVLVILAILAVILIPTLTGYIDKANQKAAMAEARSAVMAAQTLASENYASSTNPAPTAATIATLAELVPGNIDGTKLTVSGGLVTKLVYTNFGYTVTYTKATTTSAGAYGIAKTVTP